MRIIVVRYYILWYNVVNIICLVERSDVFYGSEAEGLMMEADIRLKMKGSDVAWKGCIINIGREYNEG
ncbi:MAG: hypothetical protein Q4D77_03560 [Peptostreptococcaceae bacterium]|nr:hypothetical protein [Peptostreptococcaceae bacterium]